MTGKAVNFIQKFLNKKHSRQEIIADFHTTIIRVDDNFISSSSIILDEILRGNIYSLKEVIVAGTAEITGNVTSRTASISGKVYGDIISIDYADIKSTAVISGHIRASSISIEPGAVINGSIRIEGNIDERDLIEKVENRLPSPKVKEPAFLTYIIPEEVSDLEAPVKPEIRPAEINKRPGATVSLKTKTAKSSDPEQEGKHAAPTSWY
ncbi:bactofilin family protein [Daejeonella lutea]|uniref:Polymer-forming protein n=1 Tax=Daejeonella lutea TaxID=572036 RepID=A0A1T5EDG8_9SPHI|nr:polymer-forming cytoskeletal protein [Daejeonella lutea]SKB81850.1 Polymer-forming protein [Daejeonella lutea]